MNELIDLDLCHLSLQFFTFQRTFLIFNQSLVDFLVLFRPHTEELMELEYLIVLNSFITHHFWQCKGENLHTRKFCIWVRITEVLFIPFLLGTLFHYIVPSVNLTFIVLIEQIKWSARERQNASILFLQFLHHTNTCSSFDTLMSFINHHKVPIILHNGLLQWI